MIYVLKTCPFCGKLPVEIMMDGDAAKDYKQALYRIECGNYKCLVKPCVEIKWDKKEYEPWGEIEKIKKSWNTRK